MIKFQCETENRVDRMSATETCGCKCGVCGLRVKHFSSSAFTFQERCDITKEGRPRPELTITTTHKTGNSWLAGCNSLNKLLYWHCLLFSKDVNTWTATGYCDLNNLCNAVQKHERSEELPFRGHDEIKESESHCNYVELLALIGQGPGFDEVWLAWKCACDGGRTVSEGILYHTMPLWFRFSHPDERSGGRARSPPSKGNRAKSPAGSSDFRKWKSCRRCRCSAGFLGDIPFPPPLHFGTALYSLQSPLSALNISRLRATQIPPPTLIVRENPIQGDPGDFVMITVEFHGYMEQWIEPMPCEHTPHHFRTTTSLHGALLTTGIHGLIGFALYPNPAISLKQPVS
ncbi:hypothetical protein PR048_002000 [Dryococelus australis]|uniref:Uncharacterized protein n=1 Tax=Dryococelus australis TaxID=614101 RepID=A0ABQ9IJ10_9NEOP|nr:hypothetical protein PR048_002000 [Dryococelus australis]